MSDDRRDGGFEYDGRFYTWSTTMLGKDLMLIDRFCGMSMSEFQDAAPDAMQRFPVMLALIATSLRKGNPDWSVERIVNAVMNINVDTDIVYVGPETEEATESPPAVEGPPTGVPSRSPSNGSSPPLTPLDGSTSETSFAAPM